MRLINPNHMVRDLRAGNVRTWEVVVYALVYIGSWVFVSLSYLPQFEVMQTPYSSIRVQITEMIVMYGGLLVELVVLCWINKNGDGHQFLLRYFSLNISKH